MKVKQKPLSFSLHPLNHTYIEEVVAKEKLKNHRYNRSMYMDDLITHLRTKAEAKTNLVVVKTEKPKAPVKRFVPPGLLEVETYMLEKGVHTSKNSKDEAEKFCDHFESNGWKVGGKTKMVSWKAAVRNWLKGNNNGQSQKSGQKLSAYERQVKRNDELYRQSNECELGVGATSGNLGRTVDKGERGEALIELDKGTFVDY